MSAQEIIFRYNTEGASDAQRADQKVQEQVKETAQTAQQESGAVERWMTANRAAITGVAAATLGAATAIISSSSRMRAELSGITSVFGLFADTVIADVLPASGSLTQAALNVVMAYRQLSPQVSQLISALGVGLTGAAAAVVAGLSAIPAAILGVTAGFVLWINKIGALDSALSGTFSLLKGFIAFMNADYDAALANARKGVDGWLTTWERVINNLPGMGENAVGNFIDGIQSRLANARRSGSNLIDRFASGIENRVSAARSAAGNVRDRVVGRVTDIVNTARDKGRATVDAFADGLRDRISGLRNAASDVAQTVRDFLPSSPAAQGPLSDLDKVRGAIPRTLQEGLNEGVGNVTGTLNTAPRGGGQGGGRTVNVETVEIVIQGSGNPRRDGRNAAEEVAEQFERNLGGRGV